ncbi:asparagine synthase (glutamine-hydrolyzing) [Mechercharimyces sp. CAU 1602]|uniref:asparagine synthase (glutamine-hydrolyzing) n=1 Tax=Mechercharimyces sp. CAU 1602 TaxID=2973933 RepID=UPI0021615E68|nr:asparagine synthase (glutamine-hydrolyzing) [Mechercharimyces sp. CAU 1602]MCS1352717.1 asparagine synthase (glutamine-hydrolyzing) [Mechercharimyces sp. CAU 1602]
MCGIVGWIDWQHDISQKRSIIEKMNASQMHRGPDAEGVWLSAHVALAHRRLTVIDPEGGTQPMVRNFGGRTLVITYNGELYNMPELQQQLRSRYPLTSRSDTELILAAYAEWGLDCPQYLNGIFAFAIWDEREQHLFLARDRIGVKPLFYSATGERFLFASEIKALLTHPDVEPVLDEEGLAEVFAMGPARTPGHGVFSGVNELRPGWWMRVDADGVKKKQYWVLESKDHSEDIVTTTDRVRSLVKDAILRQLVSDVPVGTMLSGGLDSSTISSCTAEAFRRAGKEVLHTFSVDYVDNDRYFSENEFQPNSDAPWVERMNAFLGSNHQRIVLDTNQLVESLAWAADARDLPGMTDVDSSLLLFCQEIKKRATVVLSGECADEVFGGYPWFHREELVNAPTFPWARLTGERARFLSPDVKRMIRPADYVDARYQEALAEVPQREGESAVEKRMREISYINLTRWMPTLLDRKDRMSMAVGLEVRVPFCDHHLVEYVWNVPWEMKAIDGQAKGLLRRAVTGLLPEDVRTRKKSPFPKTHNPAYLEAVRTQMVEILKDKTSPLLPLVNSEEIRRFAASNLSNVHLPWFGQLMNVPQLFAYFIQIDHWMRKWGIRIK